MDHRTEVQGSQQGMYERNVLVSGSSKMEHEADGVEMEGVETRRTVQLYHSHHHLSDDVIKQENRRNLLFTN